MAIAKKRLRLKLRACFELPYLLRLHQGKTQQRKKEKASSTSFYTMDPHPVAHEREKGEQRHLSILPLTTASRQMSTSSTTIVPSYLADDKISNSSYTAAAQDTQ